VRRAAWATTLFALFLAGPLATADDPPARHHGHHDEERRSDRPEAPAPNGPTVWLLTMHGSDGGNLPVAFAPDGTRLGPAVAPIPESAGGPLRDLRGMAALPDGGFLLVNAYKDDTFVARFGPGDGSLPRPLAGIPIRGGVGSPLVHPYEIAIAADGTIYLANQDSNLVTRHAPLDAANPGAPLPPPAALGGRSDLPPGTFIPSERYDPEGLREVRGVLVAADGSIVVADKKRSSVFRHDAGTGARIGTILGPGHGAVAPIQLALAPDGTILVGDNGSEKVWAIAPGDGAARVLVDCAREGLREPSALAIDGDDLLVGSRHAKRVDRFELRTGRRRGTFLADLPDAPEFLLRLGSP